MFTQLFPIIATADVGRALGFYRELLGGTVGYEFAGADGEAASVGMEIGTSHFGTGLEPVIIGARGSAESI